MLRRRWLLPPVLLMLLGCGRVIPPAEGDVNLVVLGSSTAYGSGAEPITSGWAYLYADYAQRINPRLHVINLAQGGLTTYEVQPTGMVHPADRPAVDPGKNITAALGYAPVAILINLPGNDVLANFSDDEIKANYERLVAVAAQAKVSLWVTTTRPVNVGSEQRAQLARIRDWTFQRFGDHAIDSWSVLANADGTIHPFYLASDGLHFNNAGHRLLFQRFVDAKILESLGY